MKSLGMNFQLVGAGSSVISMTIGSDVLEIDTTYVGDGLGSLLNAALDLQRGSRATFAFLPSEPGAAGLFFGAVGTDAYLQVVDFPNMMSDETPWSGGRLRWKGRLDIESFCRETVTMCEEVLALCGGESGYRELWGGIPFPAAQLLMLRAGVAREPQ